MYKKKDFDHCFFNPMTEQGMIQAYPRLQEILIPEYDRADLDRMLRYIIMMYDPKSPLVYNERDIKNRRNVAADLAGLTGELILDSVFQFTHDYLADLTFSYLQRFVKSKEWAAIIALEFTYWEAVKKLLEPIKDKNSRNVLISVQLKSAIKLEMLGDIDKLDGLYKTFFGEDKQLEGIIKKRLTPEMVASSGLAVP